ncbi:hypothetical protein C2S51_029353 [Perilla frutescens var. frutescens]|nr:hypothetical protein C2S51_029353 [Perilla frutescens var. frutescens]
MESGADPIRDNEERILVSVRLRPLNEKEISSNDVSDWECISSDTIVYKNASLLTRERSMYPTAYTFDRVFRSDSSTRMVYEQGAKDAAISVVRGVNSTILAYGETSSGKTYTMTGITEYAVADIYDYIQKHPEREFVVKFSAMEIHNESVGDLLSTDNTPLKLQDNPERGTVVENLTEEILRDRDHLTELLFICEAQRQTGDISVNELGTQSHRIIRLVLLFLDFVDLAGSERASQSLSAKTRLKEGCYTDHSLLTLGAVIHKLSKGRNENIPYRDSKLTRILQPSLCGNARTAILCTMSPARSHVEPSWDTLNFASCAKDVTTHARVNIVMSDKALVNHLQKEVARLENEMISSQSKVTSRNFSTLLREKDSQIEKLEKEVKDLILQRDIFQSQVKELLKLVGDTASSITQVGVGNYPHLRVQRSPDVYFRDQDSYKLDDFQYSDADTSEGFSRSNSGYRSVKVLYLDFEQSNASPITLASGPTCSESDLFYGWHEIDKQSNLNLEDLCREVNCPDKEHGRHRETTTNYSYFQNTTRFPACKVRVNGNQQFSSAKDQESSSLKEEIPSRIMPSKEGQESISETVIKGAKIEFPANASFLKNYLMQDQAKIPFVNRNLNLARSQSWSSSPVSNSSSPWFKMIDYTPSVVSEKECESCGRKLCVLNSGSGMERSSPKESRSPHEDTLDMETATPAGGDTPSAEDCTSSTPDTKEKADPPTEQETAAISEKESAPESNEGVEKGVKDIRLEPVAEKGRGLTSWPVEFKRLRREIIELWLDCNVSLVHRTYFFMLFQGDPTDAIYLEVEIRRMKLLKDKFSRGEKIDVDGQRLTLSSSAKTLRQERETLSELMMKKFSERERDCLFVEWGIGLNTKLRRMQLANLVWSKSEDINHINESAYLVAKLVGFLDPGQTPSKEVFGMNLTPKYSTGICTYKRSLGSLL